MESQDDMSRKRFLFHHSHRQHVATHFSGKNNNAISGAKNSGIECLLRVYQNRKIVRGLIFVNSISSSCPRPESSRQRFGPPRPPRRTYPWKQTNQLTSEK